MSDDFGDLPGEDAGSDPARPRVRKSPTAFRTISEVADELHVPQHVLRFWETKFPQVKPLKRGGGRRYYRPDDLALLRRIAELLYIQGYTIKGVQRLLREGRTDEEADAGAAPATADDAAVDLAQLSDDELLRLPDEDAAPADAPAPPQDREAERLRAALREALAALKSLRAMLG